MFHIGFLSQLPIEPYPRLILIYKLLSYFAKEREDLRIVRFPEASSICCALYLAVYNPQSQ